jgi:phosphoenolpyruvate synthase/pyruvate phosphate dikinase|tara:strand:+ start:1318 stop:1533 length:216 start_codon:yes stop_codon:yes gene_type:complete
LTASNQASSYRSGPADILIEVTFGLGSPMVMGAVEPDIYVFDTHTIYSKTIGRKQIVLWADGPFDHFFRAI